MSVSARISITHKYVYIYRERRETFLVCSNKFCQWSNVVPLMEERCEESSDSDMSMNRTF